MQNVEKDKSAALMAVRMIVLNQVIVYLFNLICAHYHRYFSSCGKNLKSRITIYKEKNVLTLG